MLRWAQIVQVIGTKMKNTIGYEFQGSGFQTYGNSLARLTQWIHICLAIYQYKLAV